MQTRSKKQAKKSGFHPICKKKKKMTYEKQYYDLEHEAGYAGARNLVRLNAKKEKKKIYSWLSNQDASTLHHPMRRRFPRLGYTVSNSDDVWEADLLQLTTIKIPTTDTTTF